MPTNRKTAYRQSAVERRTNLFPRCRRHIARNVVEVDVATQQLFLAECLAAEVTRVRLLASVRQYVALKMPLVQRRVRTQLAAEALLTLVSLQMYLHAQTP
jgi:hypothetical protein